MSIIEMTLGLAPQPFHWMPIQEKAPELVERQIIEPPKKPKDETGHDHMIRLKAANRAAIINSVRETRKSQRQISEEIGVCISTVCTAMADLVAFEIIECDTTTKPWTYLFFADNAGIKAAGR